MATESSDPRVGLIVRIGILSIGVLIAVHAIVTAYFDHLVKVQTWEKVGSLKPEALISVRADERQRLSSGAMPIDRSMEMLATKGRMGAGPDIIPSASKDIAPMQGWIQMPATVPPTMIVPSASPAASGAAPSASPAPSASAAASSAPSAGRAPGAPGAPAPAASTAPRHP